MSRAATEGYLLDTSVLSAFAPDRAAVSPELGIWLRAASDRLFVPCIAVAELEQGIAKLHRAGGVARAARLSIWLDGLLKHYGDRVLPLDAAVSRVLGRMADAAVASGQHPGFPDAAIAALAKHHALLVLTRNTRHFDVLGVANADPFVAPPT